MALEFVYNDGHTQIGPNDFFGRLRGYLPLGAGASGYLDVTRESGERVFACLVVEQADKNGTLRIANSANNYDDPDGNRIVWQLDPGLSGHICYGVF